MRREISGSPPNDVCHVTARGLFPSAPRRGRNPPGARLERPAPAAPAAKRALPCKDPQMHQKKTLLFPSGCLPLLFLPSRITLRRGRAWSRSCLSRTRKFKSSMKGLKSRNGPWFEEDDLTFTIFPEKKEEEKKNPQTNMTDFTEPLGPRTWQQCRGWERQPCWELTPSPGLCPLRGLAGGSASRSPAPAPPAVERAVLLHRKTGTSLTFIFRVFFLRERHKVVFNNALRGSHG